MRERKRNRAGNGMPRGDTTPKPARESTREKGDRGEEAAARYLMDRGFTILDRQWRCRYGELDLVARDREGTVCFVEVKLRSGAMAGLPREAVGFRKQQRLRNAAALWLAERDPDLPARFDVAEVYEEPDGTLRIIYLADAFS